MIRKGVIESNLLLERSPGSALGMGWRGGDGRGKPFWWSGSEMASGGHGSRSGAESL